MGGGEFITLAIFQWTVESLLQGIPQVMVYLDDILISVKTREEHLLALEEVLHRLERAGLCLQEEKCLFVFQKWFT